MSSTNSQVVLSDRFIEELNLQLAKHSLGFLRKVKTIKFNNLCNTKLRKACDIATLEVMEDATSLTNYFGIPIANIGNNAEPNSNSVRTATFAVLVDLIKKDRIGLYVIHKGSFAGKCMTPRLAVRANYVFTSEHLSLAQKVAKYMRSAKTRADVTKALPELDTLNFTYNHIFRGKGLCAINATDMNVIMEGKWAKLEK